MTAKLIYLASPYSHQDASEMEARYTMAKEATARLLKEGCAVFSPIVHSHPLVEFDLPTDWEFWSRLDNALLSKCDELWVLTLQGWTQSRGVRAEIGKALQREIPILLIDPQTLDCRVRTTATVQIQGKCLYVWVCVTCGYGCGYGEERNMETRYCGGCGGVIQAWIGEDEY